MVGIKIQKKEDKKKLNSNLKDTWEKIAFILAFTVTTSTHFQNFHF